MGSNLPNPDRHMEVLYRVTFNTYGQITDEGLTQNNQVGNNQKKNNTRWTADAPSLGILAGSVVATAGDGLIGPCTGGSDSTADKAVGVAINDALGQAYESSSAVASERVVYCHGSGTVFRTDIYETKGTDGTAPVAYAAGDFVYASQNGLLTNSGGVASITKSTLVGIVLKAPSGADPYMTVQMRI